MRQQLKRSVWYAVLFYPLRHWIQLRRVAKWERGGKTGPPPHLVKQRAIRAYAQEYNLKILVETGTCYGDMVEAMKRVFSRVYSIELSKELYGYAKGRFKSEKHIEIIHGDSAVELGNVVRRIDQPTLFWLDGHYSGGGTAKGDRETPIFEELKQILNAPDKGHVIIIDDARCFGVMADYPPIEELMEFVRARRPNVDTVVQDDSIRIVPKR